MYRMLSVRASAGCHTTNSHSPAAVSHHWQTYCHGEPTRAAIGEIDTETLKRGVWGDLWVAVVPVGRRGQRPANLVWRSCRIKISGVKLQMGVQQASLKGRLTAFSPLQEHLLLSLLPKIALNHIKSFQPTSCGVHQPLGCFACC